MISKYKLLCITYISILAIHCEVDEPIFGSDCLQSVNQITGNETVITPNKPYRNAPVANPANPAEFAYVGHDTNDVSGIWKYNLLTGITTLILEIEVTWVPDWSIKDWLVFGYEFQLYKCKSNGDSLLQLTFTGANYYPRWSADGERIIFHKSDGDEGINWAVIDDNGNLLETYNGVQYAGNSAAFSPDGNKIAYISTYNYLDKTVIATFNISDPLNIQYFDVGELSILGYNLNWYANSRNLLFSANSDIYNLDTQTGKITLVKWDCPDAYFYHTILADNETIVSNKSSSVYDYAENTIYKDWDLVKIHPNGTEVIIPY